MWKGIAVGTAALAIAGVAFVAAQAQTQLFSPQQPPPGAGQRMMPGVTPGGRMHWQPNIEDMRAFSEARLAGLKAGLALTAEQEKNWPAFEEAAREFAKRRLDRMNAVRNAQPSDDPAERLRRRGVEMSETGAVMKKLADAIDPLYKSLDDAQKRRFAMLSRFGGAMGGMIGMRGRDFGELDAPGTTMRMGPGRMEGHRGGGPMDDHHANEHEGERL